jgi:hypothetical protein
MKKDGRVGHLLFIELNSLFYVAVFGLKTAPWVGCRGEGAARGIKSPS